MCGDDQQMMSLLFSSLFNGRIEERSRVGDLHIFALSEGSKLCADKLMSPLDTRHFQKIHSKISMLF